MRGAAAGQQYADQEQAESAHDPSVADRYAGDPMTRFCPRCGAALALPPPVRCSRCEYPVYDNARPCAGAVVVDRGRFLAIRRAREPAAGCWDIPGGFCDERELPADAAIREVLEETGYPVELGPLVGLYLDDYQFHGDTISTLNVYYLAAVAGPPRPVKDDEATEIGWLPLRDAPTLAFPHEDRVVRDAAALVEG
jgi:8-oxo-dGTP diphosphatase